MKPDVEPNLANVGPVVKPIVVMGLLWSMANVEPLGREAPTLLYKVAHISSAALLINFRSKGDGEPASVMTILL